MYLRVWWLSGVHLVDTNDELLDTEGEGEESVLTGLAVLGDTGLELTNTSGDDKDSAIGLGGTSDHVLDEITVARGVNDGDVVLKQVRLQKNTEDLTLLVSNFQRAISMVIPRSRSALSLSKTQAYLKEPLPISWASFSNFSIVRLSIPPHL